MIPPSNTITATDHLPALHEVEFTVDQEHAKWVMRVLADTYSDRELAVVREYSTNAFDAHVQAGQARPIEVTLPSTFNPYFTVRDFGIGMSLDDLLNTYTKFGKSTGRDSNDINGMLGIGSKSGVAYTTGFTVESVKDGLKHVAVISRKPDWTITLKVVATSKTDEHNGVTIKIPVHNPDEFTHKANDFYKFWLPGRVLVNGKAPEHNVGDKITDNFYYSPSWNTSYVVMNNVPYRINNPDALFRNTKIARCHFVAYVSGGAVEFSNSREDLKYTDLTKATLQQIINEFADQIVREAQDSIDKATTHAEAFSAWYKWRGVLGNSALTELEFNGDKFIDVFPINAMRYDTNYGRGSTWRVSQHLVTDMPHTLIITDYNIEVSSNNKAKAKEYVGINGIKASKYLFTSQSAVDNVWVDQSRVVSWDDLKAALPKKPKKPRVQNVAPGRVPGSWDYFTINGQQYEKTLPAKGDVFYVMVRRSKNLDVIKIMKALGMDANASVILMPANRLDKFKRENPNVKEFYAYAKSKVVTDTKSLLTEDSKRYLSLDRNYREFLEKIDVKNVDDPIMVRDAGLSKDTAAYDKNIALAQLLGMRYTVEEYNGVGTVNHLDKYPLINTRYYYNSVDPKHAVIYINAAYKARQEGTLR